MGRPGGRHPWMDVKRIPYSRGTEAFRDALKKREEFESNSMRGRPCVGSTSRTGYAGDLNLADERVAGMHDADYVIVSYSTPIAWHSKSRGWECPKITYSSTTGRQQSIIRDAIAMLGYRPCHPRICPARTGDLSDCICTGPWDMTYFEDRDENTALPVEEERRTWTIAA